MDIIKNKHSLNVNIIDFNDEKSIGLYPIVVFQSTVNKPSGTEIYLNIESISLSNKLDYNIYPIDSDKGELYSGKLKITRNKNNVISIPCNNYRLFFISIIIEKYFIDCNEITSEMKNIPEEDYYDTNDYLYYGMYQVN